MNAITVLQAIKNFIHMGGYAMYVWPAYGVTLSIFIFNIVAALQTQRRAWQQLQRYYQAYDESTS